MLTPLPPSVTVRLGIVGVLLATAVEKHLEGVSRWQCKHSAGDPQSHIELAGKMALVSHTDS